MDMSIEPVGKLPAHRPVRVEVTPEQIRYIQLKLSTPMSNVAIAKQLNVHYNTITNWSKTDIVRNEIETQMEILRKDNLVGMSRLMSTIIREAEAMLGDDGLGTTLKMELIGRLFSQAGKFAGLEPAKAVEKKVTVIKSIEQMIDCEAIDVDAE